jgi:hypothetical protein
MATITETENKLGTYLTAHHFVLYACLVLALLVGVYLFESKRAEIDAAKAEVAKQQLVAEKDHSAQLVAVYAQQQAVLEKENENYRLTITQVQAQVKTVIVHDKALPAPELGHRIETITGFKQGTITLDSSQDLVVPLPLAVDITMRLDQGIADAETVMAENGYIANQTKTIASQTQIIAEDKIVLADQIKADGKELTSCKASARKGKLKYLGIGIAIGYGLRLLTKAATGV